MWIPPPEQVYGQMFKGMLINPWDNPWTRMIQQFWMEYWRLAFASAAPPAARPSAEIRLFPGRRARRLG